MKNQKKNHGHAIADKPVPVVLTIGTLVKLIAAVMGPFLVIISAALFWYHKTNLHMDNSVIHLRQNERGTLETKPEAKEAREKMVQEIKRHVGLKIREVAVEQRSSIQDLKRELIAEGRADRTQIVREVRRVAAPNGH